MAAKKKTKRKNLSPRKKVLLKKIDEKVRNGEPLIRTKLMKAAGYSEKYAAGGNGKKPFKEVLEQYFPDSLVAKVEEGQMMAGKIDHYVFPESMEDEQIIEILESYPNTHVVKIAHSEQWKRAYFSAPDNAAIGKSLDRIYKLKGQYAAEKIQWTDPLEQMDDEELDKEIARLEKEVAGRQKQAQKKMTISSSKKGEGA